MWLQVPKAEWREKITSLQQIVSPFGKVKKLVRQLFCGTSHQNASSCLSGLLNFFIMLLYTVNFI